MEDKIVSLYVAAIAMNLKQLLGMTSIFVFKSVLK